MSAISDKVLGIAVTYLGPAAKQFIDRQCKAHLNTDFDSIGPAHVPELAKWIKISAGLILDKTKSEEFANKVLALK